MNSAKNDRGIKNVKIPKGYRLKIITHNKIKEIQLMTNGSQDMVISRAISLYLRKIPTKSKGLS
jgi:hypothetical protein